MRAADLLTKNVRHHIVLMIVAVSLVGCGRSQKEKSMDWSDPLDPLAIRLRSVKIETYIIGHTRRWPRRLTVHGWGRREQQEAKSRL